MELPSRNLTQLHKVVLLNKAGLFRKYAISIILLTESLTISH